MRRSGLRAGSLSVSQGAALHALNDRGRGLDDALRQAILWLREGRARRDGTGRLAVKRKLEALRDEDARLPTGERKYRTLTQEFFHQLCTEAGGISSPELLLDYLHQSGVVFYRKRLFDDRIVLDQAWALEAIYAVFHRQKCYRQLRQLRGRFTRAAPGAGVAGVRRPGAGALPELDDIMWHLLRSSTGRRRRRPGNGVHRADLLPEREGVKAEIEALWPGGGTAAGNVRVLPFMHPGVMRGIISRIGREAGISAVYWKYGVCLYETTTQSHALIEERLSHHPGTWSGQVVVRTRGGRAEVLILRLMDWIVQELDRSGCRNWKTDGIPYPARSVSLHISSRPHLEREGL